MKGATHFIEVFKSKSTGKVHQSRVPVPIVSLDHYLAATKKENWFQTIAVFEIKKNESSVSDENTKLQTA